MSLYEGWDPPRAGWVCSECGFDFDATPPSVALATLQAMVPEYKDRLETPEDQLRSRPAPSTWSALEYACHVRDCLALYDWRIRKVLAEDRPELPQMRRDAVVVERAYNHQSPAGVAQDINANQAELAAVCKQISRSGWQRIGVREGAELSVTWMIANTTHEVRHHLMDIDRVLGRVGRS